MHRGLLDDRCALAPLVFVFIGCAPSNARLALLEDRVARLEAASSMRRAEESAPLQPAETSACTQQVAFQVGDAEFYDGDEVSISEVRGTRGTFEVGESYVVRGHYKLRSRDRATLLLSVTASEGSGRSWTAPVSKIDALQGEGDFELRKRFASNGYPHVTFYGADGKPFGGVYFGGGPWLLAHKNWRYR